MFIPLGSLTPAIQTISLSPVSEANLTTPLTDSSRQEFGLILQASRIQNWENWLSSYLPLVVLQSKAPATTGPEAAFLDMYMVITDAYTNMYNVGSLEACSPRKIFTCVLWDCQNAILRFMAAERIGGAHGRYKKWGQIVQGSLRARP